MKKKTQKYNGEAIVRGKGLGQVVVVNIDDKKDEIKKIKFDEIPLELERFNKARVNAQKYYDERSKKIPVRGSDASARKDEAAIIEMYKYIASDPILIKQVHHSISTEFVNAETALTMVIDTMTETFTTLEDEYFKDRGKDIEEVGFRISYYLGNKEGEEEVSYDKDVVLFINRSLVLSDIIGNDIKKIRAIVCLSAGKTSHAVIVARSNSIPVISNVNIDELNIDDGDAVLVDGDIGEFVVNPTARQQDDYFAYINEISSRKSSLASFLKYPVFTTDGKSVTVMANVSIADDAKLAKENGCDGIGLVRTEILFIDNLDFPSEKEQIEYYNDIFDKVKQDNQRVNIRVMDIGGDKMVKFVDVPEEQNPFMGWRAVRIYRDKNEILEQQLTAILKAGQGNKYGVMFPMITTFSEWQYLREIVVNTAEKLGVECPKLGILFEVPLAILEIGTFLNTIDFASIGTNDLIQYLSAADRSNAKVNYLYNPIEPAFLKILKNAIDECQLRGKPIAMCGDMATRPECTILLLGLGLTRFSVSPPMIPIIKEIVISVSFVKIKEETEHLLSTMKNTEHVAEWLDSMNEKYCKAIFDRYRFVPNVREL